MTEILIGLSIVILLLLLIFGYFLIRLYIIDIRNIKKSIANLRELNCLFYDKSEIDSLLEDFKSEIAVTYSKKRKRKKS